HQRPDLFNLVALDVKQASALRRVKPFVQTGAEIVAGEILLLEVKLRKRMRAVNDSFDTSRTRHFANRFHRSDLASDVDLMRHQNKSCAVGYSLLKRRQNLVQVLWRNRNFYQLKHEALALLAL